MYTASKTISLTKAQQKALIWAINIWENSMDGYEEDVDDNTANEIQEAREALQTIYIKLDE
jgi:hypothetical protein